MFIGRESEFELLEKSYKDKKSILACVYGRRRVGKSELLKRFGKKTQMLYFEGLENGRTPDQIQVFVSQLRQQLNDVELYRLDLTSWDKIFDFLTDYFSKKRNKKTYLVFDEFQWIAAGQSKLVSLIKIYWDRSWKNQNIFFVLCGSVASFMVRKVIKSKALYGRIDLQLNVLPLNLSDAVKFFKHKSQDDIISYLSIFNSIPKYLSLIDNASSFDKNMLQLCFQKDAYFITEIEKIFYSHFKEAENYKKIVVAIAKRGNLNAEEIARVLGMKSGGGIKTYIENLTLAHFISPVKNFALRRVNVKYRITDPYLKFYFKFIAPHLSGIQSGKGQAIYLQTVKPTLISWLGLAFENLCLIHDNEVARALKIQDEVIDSGVYCLQGNALQPGVQIDLAFKLADGAFALVEIKNVNDLEYKKIMTNILQKRDIVFSKEKVNIFSYLLLSKDIKNKKLEIEDLDRVIYFSDLLYIV